MTMESTRFMSRHQECLSNPIQSPSLMTLVAAGSIASRTLQRSGLDGEPVSRRVADAFPAREANRCRTAVSY